LVEKVGIDNAKETKEVKKDKTDKKKQHESSAGHNSITVTESPPKKVPKKKKFTNKEGTRGITNENETFKDRESWKWFSKETKSG